MFQPGSKTVKPGSFSLLQTFMLAVSRGDAGASWLAVSDRALIASAPLAALAIAAHVAFGGQGQVGLLLPCVGVPRL